MATILLGGVPYTPSSLKAVFQAEADAMFTSDTAKKAAQAAVVAEKAARAKANQVLSALRSYLLGTYGAQAVTVLGDFGIEAPKSKATKTVSTKAVAVAKAKATRVARGTKGSVAKKATVGTVDAQAIKAAIDSPAAMPAAPPALAAAPPSPAALPAPAPTASKAGA